MVALVGEPGVGKSRVIREFTEGPWIAGALVLEGRPIAYRRTPSWLPVIEALRRYFHVEPRDDARVIREKIAAKVVALDPALEPAVPALHALADLEPDDPAWRRSIRRSAAAASRTRSATCCSPRRAGSRWC